MANVPYPITGPDLQEMRMQIQELIRQIYEEKIGGADLGDVFSLPGDVLTLVTKTDGGLTKEGNELAVELSSTGALNIVSDGLSVKLADATLTKTASGLSVTVPAPTGAAVTVTDETTYDLGTDVGVGTRYARNDHTHGSPIAPIQVDGFYINASGVDPNTELGYGNWIDETSIGAQFYELTIGDGSADIDPYLMFNGESNDGYLYWMEDEDYFKFNDDILLPTNEKVQFSDTSSYITDDGTNLSIVTNEDINITCGANKTIELQNVVYDDIRVSSGNIDRPGIDDPTWKDVQPGGGAIVTRLLEFAIDDVGTFTVQIPHGYKIGQDIKVHLHWTPGTRGNEENGKYVGWKVDYSWANIGDAFGAMGTAVLTDACNGVDWEHQMTPEATIDGHTVAKGISSMLICNVKRTDTGVDDDWASSTSGQLPLLLEVDFHFPIDTIGSRDWGSK